MRSPPGLGLLAALAQLSCSGPTDATPVSVHGSWVYSETLYSSSDRQTCAMSGTLAFVQQGSNIGGTYLRNVRCSSPSLAAANRGESGPLGGGRVEDKAVRFEIGGCRYQGVLSTVRDFRRLSGTVLCTGIGAGGVQLGASGAWQADELAPAGSAP